MNDTSFSLPLIQGLPPSTLKPDPKNPRLHSKKQIRQIANSIKTFGFIGSILVDRNHMVIAGHGRLEAAELLGMTQVPVIMIEHLTEAQLKAYMIADNRLAENAEWDDPKLAEAIQELSGLDLDFRLEDVLGFEVAEMDILIQGLNIIEEGKPDPADQIPEVQQQAVSKPGDLWRLDKHSVYCGDSQKEESYIRLLNGNLAAAIFTDPPYNVRISGHVGGLGNIQHPEFAMASGEMSGAEFLAFLKTSCAFMSQFSADGSLHYICMDWRHLRELLEAGHAAYTEHKNICVWVKDNGGMGSLYRSQHEMVCLFKKGTASHRNNVELGKHGRYRTNVWSYPGANSFSRKTEEGDLLALHPTTKNVTMVADALLDCTARGDIVLDSFLGSGS